MKETVWGVIGEFEYNTDLFDPETISRMAEHFQTLLESKVGDAETTHLALKSADRIESPQPLVHLEPKSF